MKDDIKELINYSDFLRGKPNTFLNKYNQLIVLQHSCYSPGSTFYKYFDIYVDDPISIKYVLNFYNDRSLFNFMMVHAGIFDYFFYE